MVGKAIKGRKREDIILATKVGLDIYNDNARNSKASKIREEIEESLQRLGTDYIDLYQVHWPDLDTPFEETFTELNKLRESGKARYIGVSNFTRNRWTKRPNIAPSSAHSRRTRC